LISFIWSPGNALPAGTGGSENYTVGQVRELTRRGIPAQVVTVGLGQRDGRDGFSDIPFLSLPTLSAVSELDDTVIFVNEAHTVPTRHPAFLILHNPPPIRERYRAFAVEGTRELTLIATSRYAARLWADYLDVDVATIAVVYPFAEPGFAVQPRPVHEAGETRVLFAGRLAPRKASTPCSRRCTSTSSSSTRGSRSPRRPRAPTSRRERSSSGCSTRTPASRWWAAARRRPRWRP